ncbi:MAG: hypothetical protein ABEK01_04810 [Candidatus Nanohaloarchaea archaeon]
MEVKGVTLKNQEKFVKEKFGEDGWEDLMEEFSEDTRELMEDTVLKSSWYPFDSFSEITRKICEEFYDGKPKDARELGRFHAEEVLSGIYRVWVKFTDPQGLADKSPMVLRKHYRPIEVEVVENVEGKARIRITELPVEDRYFEELVAGSMERGPELVGAENLEVEITSSIASGDDYIEYLATYD